MVNFVALEPKILKGCCGFLLQVSDYKGFNCNHWFIYVLNGDAPWIGNVMRDSCNWLQLFIGAFHSIQEDHDVRKIGKFFFSKSLMHDKEF